MKKKKNLHRKLRKCELGKKTRSFNKGHRYILTSKGFIPVSIVNRFSLS